MPFRTSRYPVQSRSVVSIAIALAIGLFAIYWIPFHVPARDDMSLSYLAGFNNRAAIFLLVAFTLGFALWTRGLGLNLPSPASEHNPSFRRTGAIAIVVSSLGSATVWFFSRHIVLIKEAQYFIDRYEMYRLAGHVYRSVDFIYGPLMFYCPLWIATLFHLSIGNSYYIALILEYALGTWALWKTVQVAARGTSHGRAIFLFLWSIFLLLLCTCGAQYTPLRFCPTLAFALGVHHLYFYRGSMLATFSLASVGAVTMLSFSPEQGLIFAAGTLLFFLVCVRARRPGTFAGLAGFMMAVAAAFSFAFRQGWLDSVFAFGGGALNLPVIASFQSALLLLLLIVAGCVLVASLRNHTSNHPLIYLICLAIFGMPAAFFRADNGHIIINTLGALIAALVVLSQYPAIWRWTWISFAIMLLIFAQSFFPLYRELFRQQILIAAFDPQYHSATIEKLVKAAIDVTNRSNAAQRIETLRALYAPEPLPDAPRLPRSTLFYAPMGVQRRIDDFPGHPQIVSSRFAFVHVATAQQQIAELEVHSNWPILLPYPAPIRCDSDPAQIRQLIKEILYVPYMPPVRHPIVATLSFCDYLNTHFTPTAYLSPAPGSFVWLPTEK